ncbi:conserved hypothetical protein [Candidatus Desulfarcum epimagneticum]|uniref:DUF3795 domain-containing protein n=1 Tax=uncultured Desulfobacteraceae bacterium TaxID=218296 RepID=A0A484HEN4_9BACT|nr:conserved hypothetical protein [uncultured Desulfobacteraceae bacterium]
MTDMTACCGLDCSQCDARVATLEDSEAKRKETAKKWSEIYQADIKPDDIRCDGCRRDGAKFHHCEVCEIRACVLSRDLPHCAACGDYICDALAGFIKLAPEAGAALEKLREA